MLSRVVSDNVTTDTDLNIPSVLSTTSIIYSPSYYLSFMSIFLLNSKVSDQSFDWSSEYKSSKSSLIFWVGFNARSIIEKYDIKLLSNILFVTLALCLCGKITLSMRGKDFPYCYHLCRSILRIVFLSCLQLLLFARRRGETGWINEILLILK